MERRPALSGDLGWLGLVAGVAAVAHLTVLERYGVFRDELYYVACGEHLAWGYVDHPPLVAVMAKASRLLLGSSVGALRVLPLLFAVALVFVTGAIARRLGGGRFAQGLAATCVVVPLQYLFVFHVLSMNASEVLLWALSAYLAIVAIQTERPWPWIAFGVTAGVGLLNKHGMLIFGLGVLVGLLGSGARRHLKTPWPWLAGLVAAAIFLPHVVWQVQHGWPTREFVENAQRYKIAQVSTAEFLGAQMLLMHPLTAPVWLAGLAFFAWRREGRPYRLFAWCYGVVLLVLLAQRSKAYYVTPIYPVLLAGGSVWIESLTEHARWVRPVALAALIAAGAALAPLALPLLPVETFIRYQNALGIRPDSGERHHTGALPQHFADMHGWEEMARVVSEAYLSLPAEERATARVFAQNYGEAGAVDFFRGKYALPPVVCPHNSYWLWGPGPDGGTLLIIGGRIEDHRDSLDRVEEVARVTNPYGMPYERDLPIFVGRGWKASLREAWPREKRFI